MIHLKLWKTIWNSLAPGCGSEQPRSHLKPGPGQAWEVWARLDVL